MSQRRQARKEIATARREAVAREAARRLTSADAIDIRQAREEAAETLDAHDRQSLPSAKRIRQHAQAMEMQSLGQAEYVHRRRVWLELTEDLMATLEQIVPDCETKLVGRAAEEGGGGGAGHFDGDPSLHIRILTHRDIGEIARLLADYGYDVAEATFPTFDTKHHGRLSQMSWRDEGLTITLTRCPQRSVFESETNLMTGQRQASATLKELQSRLGEARR